MKAPAYVAQISTAGVGRSIGDLDIMVEREDLLFCRSRLV